MGRIRILSDDVRSKIAAGEVILRPSSVVKELIENSIDAGAKRIEIEIEEGGKKKLLVNDDGSGMSYEDALLSIERYSTSKLEKIEDIENILTLGFRGEALASIAQVCVLEIETSDGNEGTRIIVEGGEKKGIFHSSRPKGTRVKVNNLFFNLPARQKFLKSNEYERRLILETIRNYALIYTSIHFILQEKNRTILNLPEATDFRMRINKFFGENFAKSFIPLNFSLGDISFEGLFSPVDFAEDYGMNFIYVNYRPARYPRVYRAILGAYENNRNPPQFLINIKLPPQLVDVNIHPTKSEVKFKDERYIIDLLVQGLRRYIFKKPTITEPVISTKTLGLSNAHFVQEVVLPYVDAPFPATTIKEQVDFWQLHNTFILAQTSSGLIIVDQHIAHERIIYESILSGKSMNQRLLFPITIELTPEEYDVYKRTKESLEAMGIEFKEFSERTLVIESLPTNLKVTRDDLKDFFTEIGSLGELMNEKKELAKVVACHMAIKSGQKLSQQEMQSLIDTLFACENPYFCPHDRPIIIKITIDELNKRFGR